MDRDEHKNLINNFLLYLNKQTNDFVLKGGTALMLCYGLDRFSTDIDLDGDRKLDTIVKNFCKKNNIDYNIKKDTEFVERFMLHYGENELLKIEVSHRKYNSFKKQPVIKNSINTYAIQDLFSFKVDCLNQRVKIRDFYDVCFIYNNYKEYLKDDDIYRLEDFLNKNEGNYYEYITKTQEDNYIDKNVFENYYINMITSFDNNTKNKENFKGCSISEIKIDEEQHENLLNVVINAFHIAKIEFYIEEKDDKKAIFKTEDKDKFMDTLSNMPIDIDTKKAIYNSYKEVDNKENKKPIITNKHENKLKR